MAFAATASVGVAKLAAPLAPAFRTMNLFEKSRPPVNSPIGGIMISFTSELTIEPNAAPMITPTARSTALPLMANSLNSFHMKSGLLGDHDVHKFFWNNHHLADSFTGKELLNFWQRQNQGLDLFLRGMDRHGEPIAHLPVYLDGDFNLILNQEQFVVRRPGLCGDL